jgi:hypothetical protein
MKAYGSTKHDIIPSNWICEKLTWSEQKRRQHECGTVNDPFVPMCSGCGNVHHP